MASPTKATENRRKARDMKLRMKRHKKVRSAARKAARASKKK